MKQDSNEMSARATEYNGTGLVIASTVLLCLTWVALPLRVFVRLYLTKSFAIDDWFIVLSQLIFTCSCTFILLGVHHGLGRHNDTLGPARESDAKMYQALATLFYVADMMFIKISIALFLLRIAVKQKYIWILRISIVIVTIWSTAIFFFSLFQCKPVEAQWDPRIKNGTCVSGSSFVSAAYSISVMTILSDWLYALLPVPMIWKVKMSIQAKITVIFVLSLGVFASVATLVRMKFLIELADPEDNLFEGTNSMIWTLVEPGIAIFAASVITMRPLLRALNFPGFESTTATSAYPHSSSYRLENDVDTKRSRTATTKTYTELDGGSENITTTDGARKSMNTRVVVGDCGSEEYILQGITRTVDFSVEHSNAGSVSKRGAT